MKNRQWQWDNIVLSPCGLSSGALNWNRLSVHPCHIQFLLKNVMITWSKSFEIYTQDPFFCSGIMTLDLLKNSCLGSSSPLITTRSRLSRSIWRLVSIHILFSSVYVFCGTYDGQYVYDFNILVILTIPTEENQNFYGWCICTHLVNPGYLVWNKIGIWNITTLLIMNKYSITILKIIEIISLVSLICRIKIWSDQIILANP